MRVSILHRATGNGLAFVGLATLLCWLAAIAGGPAAYAKFAAVAGSIPGKVVLMGVFQPLRQRHSPFRAGYGRRV